MGFPTLETIDRVAGRIEAAYRRRFPDWSDVGSTPGVWESAARRLFETDSGMVGLPIDPELYGASQIPGRLGPEPWADLTQSRSLTRYRRCLRGIILQLRRELRVEIARAECRMLRGVSLDELLETEGARLSPLSCYILSHRLGRADLALKLHSAAVNQHRSCPLYRIAARSLLPAHAYPSTDQTVDAVPAGTQRPEKVFSHN